MDEFSNYTSEEPSRNFIQSLIYYIFVVLTVFYVYIASVYMTYVVLSDIVFQITHLFITLGSLFETTLEDMSTIRLLEFTSQICWVLYSFAVISLILMIVVKQISSFFSRLWTVLSYGYVTGKIRELMNNLDYNRKVVAACLITYGVLLVGIFSSFIIELCVCDGRVYYSAYFMIVFMLPVVYGVVSIIVESWRLSYLLITKKYDHKTHEPYKFKKSLPFPIDFIDPAGLRKQEEIFAFLKDPQTNVYIRRSSKCQKAIGCIHIVALLIGISLKFWFLSTDSSYDKLGFMICFFYLASAPFLVFVNFFTIFKPKKSFEGKGHIRYVFFAVGIIYIVIFAGLILLSIIVLAWETPKTKYSYKFYTQSSLMKAYWTLTNQSATTCGIQIKGMSFSQISALPILSYFIDDEFNPETTIHNREVILGMALSSLTERKVTEVQYLKEDNLIYIKDGKLHIIIPKGVTSALDWVLLFEQIVQYYYFSILRTLIPFYNIVFNWMRIPLILTSKYFCAITSAQFLTTNVALNMEKKVHQLIDEDKPTYTIVSVGHLTGGYFAKYLASITNLSIAGIGFDSYSYQGTPLELQHSKKGSYGYTVNVFGKSSLFSGNEDLTKNNFERAKYPHVFPDAVQSFCESVAMCSNNRVEIDFCHTTLGNEFIEMMASYLRYPTFEENYTIGVNTNKQDFIK